MGIPIVATDHGGSREIVRPDVAGWLVSPDDPRALADAINSALSLDDTKRATLASAARAHVVANFSLDMMCARTLAIYKYVLESAKQG